MLPLDSFVRLLQLDMASVAEVWLLIEKMLTAVYGGRAAGYSIGVEAYVLAPSGRAAAGGTDPRWEYVEAAEQV